jgi:hypothetical protein
MPFLQVRYSASLPALPLGLSGEHFVAVAGAQASSLESLLVRRGLRGPGWTTLSAPTRREGSGMVRGCVTSVCGRLAACCLIDVVALSFVDAKAAAFGRIRQVPGGGCT